MHQNLHGSPSFWVILVSICPSLPLCFVTTCLLYIWQSIRCFMHGPNKSRLTIIIFVKSCIGCLNNLLHFFWESSRRHFYQASSTLPICSTFGPNWVFGLYCPFEGHNEEVAPSSKCHLSPSDEALPIQQFVGAKTQSMKLLQYLPQKNTKMKLLQ